jgi:hypothetical protein
VQLTHGYGGSGDFGHAKCMAAVRIPLIYIRSITNSQVGGKSFNRLCWEYLMYSLLLSFLNCILHISGGIPRASPDHHLNVPLTVTLTKHGPFLHGNQFTYGNHSRMFIFCHESHDMPSFILQHLSVMWLYIYYCFLLLFKGERVDDWKWRTEGRGACDIDASTEYNIEDTLLWVPAPSA